MWHLLFVFNFHLKLIFSRVSTVRHRDVLTAPMYAEAFCRVFRATTDANPSFFSTSRHITLKELAKLPQKFYLDMPGADKTMVRDGMALLQTPPLVASPEIASPCLRKPRGRVISVLGSQDRAMFFDNRCPLE